MVQNVNYFPNFSSFDLMLDACGKEIMTTANKHT